MEVGVLVDPGERRAGLVLEVAHELRDRRSSARTRRAARRRAAWRRRSRSRASAGAPRTRSSRRSASRGGSGPGSSSRKSSTRLPCQSPSACSVVAASSGVNGSAWRLVKMLSRPNIVMNHGSPAAGRLRPRRSAARSGARRGRRGCAGRSPSASRQSHSRRGASVEPASRGSAPCSAEPGVRRVRTSAARTSRRHRPRVTTSRSVVHAPCGSIVTRERQALLVDLRRSRRGDRRLAPERLALVAEHAGGRFSTRVEYVPFFFERVLDLEEVGEVAAGLDPHGRASTGFLVVVQDRQLLVEAVARPRAGGSRTASRRCIPCRCPGPGRSASRSTGDRRPRARSAARPFTVSTHVDRKRVSNENRPVGSVSAARQQACLRPSVERFLPCRSLLQRASGVAELVEEPVDRLRHVPPLGPGVGMGKAIERRGDRRSIIPKA